MPKSKPNTKLDLARAIVERYDALIAKTNDIQDAELRAVAVSAISDRADGELRRLFPANFATISTTTPPYWGNTASGGA